jgi:hypothetical protein
MDDLLICMDYRTRSGVIFFQRADTGAPVRAASKVNTNHYAIVPFIGIHDLLVKFRAESLCVNYDISRCNSIHILSTVCLCFPLQRWFQLQITNAHGSSLRTLVLRAAVKTRYLGKDDEESEEKQT